MTNGYKIFEDVSCSCCVIVIVTLCHKTVLIEITAMVFFLTGLTIFYYSCDHGLANDLHYFLNNYSYRERKKIHDVG